MDSWKACLMVEKKGIYLVPLWDRMLVVRKEHKMAIVTVELMDDSKMAKQWALLKVGLMAARMVTLKDKQRAVLLARSRETKMDAAKDRLMANSLAACLVDWLGLLVMQKDVKSELLGFEKVLHLVVRLKYLMGA